VPFGLGKKSNKKKEEWMKKLGLSEEELRNIQALLFVFGDSTMHKKISRLTGVDAEKIDSVRRDGPITHTTECSSIWIIRTTHSSYSSQKC